MFEPRYIKHSHLLIRHAEKLIRYRRDRLSEKALEDLQIQIERLRVAMKARDRSGTETEAEKLDALITQHAPPHRDSIWRENVEVILVAIVVAIGVRSYFIQPFKIPTGSMQPTLNGIIGHPSRDPAPNLLQRGFEFLTLGRNYIDVVSATDNTIVNIVPQKFLFFFTLSRIECDHQTFTVYAPPEILRQDFQVYPGNTYHAGQVIARGSVDTGDQVFVDKFSYNFIHPRRGDVFVFRTDHILGIREDPVTGAPFFIKRLTGTPGDTLRIDSPNLYVNGALAQSFGIRRVMSAVPPYRGYSQGPEKMELSNGDFGPGLANAGSSYTVPAKNYFAMGDNSYNSYDSRYWGPVPQENVVGRGLLVYWPFNRHWGLIR